MIHLQNDVVKDEKFRPKRLRFTQDKLFYCFFISSRIITSDTLYQWGPLISDIQKLALTLPIHAHVGVKKKRTTLNDR